jgi:AcrR family transcriptional regulator
MRNRDLDETRTELLEAGMRLLVREGVDLGMSGLPVTAVAKEAGRTTGAIYQIWKTQRAFHRDLALEAAERQTWGDAGVIAAVVTKELERGAEFDDLITKVADAYLGHLSNTRTFYVIVHFWGAALDDEGLREAIKTGYDSFHRDFTTLLKAMLDMYQMRPREPHTIDDIAVAVAALAEGYALRVQIDPDNVRATDGNRPGSYASALVPLVRSMVEVAPS